MTKGDINDKNLWIGDTGESCHMTNQWDGFYEVWEQNAKAQFAHASEEVKISKGGNWRGLQTEIHPSGTHLKEQREINLNNVLFVPTLRHNLYSITQGIAEGGVLTNKGNNFHLNFKKRII